MTSTSVICKCFCKKNKKTISMYKSMMFKDQYSYSDHAIPHQTHKHH
jgi:hypothetical protein